MDAVAQHEISIDERSMREVRELLQGYENMIPRVIRRAINRTLSRVRTKMVKDAANATGMKQKVLRSRIWRNLARRQFFGKVRAGAAGWPLSLFEPREIDVPGRLGKASVVRRGVTVKIFGKRTVAEGAFMARMPTGHEGVFVRRTPERLPIKEARTPSLSFILETHGLVPGLLTFGQSVFNAELIDAAEYYQERELKKGLTRG